MKDFKKSLGISLVALFLIVGGSYALTITGSPQEIRQLIQNDGLLGSGGYVVDSPPANINSGLTPTTNNTYDVGSYALSWKDIYASGTLFVNTIDVGTFLADAAVIEPLTLGNGSSASVLYGSLNTTSTFINNIELLGSGPNGLLTIGSGTATTSIRGGSAGLATSTFAGDVDIQDLYVGLMEFNTDAGVVDAFDMGVTPTPALNDRMGYAFLLDGFPIMTVFGAADSVGSVTSTGIGIRTQYPSSTPLHVANDYFEKANNPATTTIYVGTDTISPGCIVVQDTDRLGWSYCTTINGVMTCNTVSCE